MSKPSLFFAFPFGDWTYPKNSVNLDFVLEILYIYIGVQMVERAFVSVSAIRELKRGKKMDFFCKTKSNF